MIVKVVNGYEIEERVDRKGNKYYVVWCGSCFNKAYSLEEAIALVHVITR